MKCGYILYWFGCMSKLVLCPLKIELDELRKGLSALGIELTPVVLSGTLQQRTVFKGILGSSNMTVYFSHTGLGKVESALWTHSFLNQLSQIDHVYSCGTCGSLSDSIQVLDLVVATEIVEHDFRQLFLSKPQPKFKCTPMRLPEMDSSVFNLHVGVLASGDEDIVSPERKAELHEKFGAIAVAWESAGFSRACRHFKISHNEIRCVTDLSDSTDFEKFQLQLPKAMHKIAKFLAFQF